jgi:hypothetical protein
MFHMHDLWLPQEAHNPIEIYRDMPVEEARFLDAGD